MEILILMVVLIVIIAFIIFWCREFIFMMALGDSDYTGRFDKPLWFFTFFIFFSICSIFIQNLEEYY